MPELFTQVSDILRYEQAEYSHSYCHRFGADLIKLSVKNEDHIMFPQDYNQVGDIAMIKFTDLIDVLANNHIDYDVSFYSDSIIVYTVPRIDTIRKVYEGTEMWPDAMESRLRYTIHFTKPENAS